MWEIMWIFSLLPNFVYHILLIVGIAAFAGSYLLTMIPFFTQNAFMIRIASMILIIFCVWMEGGMAVEAKWKARVTELELKVAKAEKEAAEANGKIETVYVDRVKVIKEIQYLTQERISKDADKLDKTCKIDPEAIEILNQAAHSKVKK
jgi:hypothetical protein